MRAGILGSVTTAATPVCVLARSGKPLSSRRLCCCVLRIAADEGSGVGRHTNEGVSMNDYVQRSVAARQSSNDLRQCRPLLRFVWPGRGCKKEPGIVDENVVRFAATAYGLDLGEQWALSLLAVRRPSTPVTVKPDNRGS